MSKFTLPSVNLDLTLEAGKMKALTNTAGVSKNTEYVVPVDQLRVIPGFNVRVTETDDYRADLDALKQSIREHGFYPNKPLAGYIGKDGDADVIYITDGHRRLEAVQEINDEAVDDSDLTIEGLPVVLKSAESSLADLTIALVQDNSGRPLTPYEKGVVAQRLANMKGEDGEPAFSKADIARKLSVTERFVDDLNLLVDAPAKLRNHVIAGTVSSTLAIEELRKNPKKAVERIEAAVAKATSAGKKKATKKDISAVKMQKVKATVSLATGDSIKDVLKAMAAKVRETVGHDDEDVLTMDGTITVTMEVPAPEKPKAEKKAAAKKPAAKKATAKKADADDTAETKPAAKKATAKKSTAKKTAAPKAEATSADDGEPAKLPPKVESDTADDPDDI